MDNVNLIKNRIFDSIAVKHEFVSQAENIQRAVDAIVNCYKHNGKVLICGNGGSAADSQHIAGELVGRYKMERRALSAIALTTDTSILTALPNDYSFEIVFARQVEAHALKRDVLIGISTSGNSLDVLRALEKGREIGTCNISFTGCDGGRIRELSDININSYSKDTPRIQECHQVAYHTICELVERELFGGNINGKKM